MAPKSVFALLSCLVTVCGCLFGCVSISTCPNKSRFSAETRSYFLDFKPGDYWIYKNLANGDIDSVYFVSQEIFGSGDPANPDDCPQEYAKVNFYGFGNKPFGYVVNSWGRNFEITSTSFISFLSEVPNLSNNQTFQAQGVRYDNAITLIHCCISGCYKDCSTKYFQFDRLYFAPRRGIIRWEASNHPQFGSAVYELIRTNIK